MKNILLKTFLLTLFFLTINYASDKKVLVEVLTNSHCPKCPPAHGAINAYLQNSPNASKINFIFYHMIFPYPDDQLYKDNPQDAAGRNSYYGPFSQTPVGFFDGIQQGANYSSWGSVLDALVTAQSPMEISLSGTKINDTLFSVVASIKQTESITENDLKIYLVVVENVHYAGRNGINDHKHVMRKMLISPTGESFSINLNETKEVKKDINVDSIWNAENLSVVVFVQSASTKKIFQSETINYSDITVTSVDNENFLPSEFNLSQNYPNPFNPSTKIQYAISSKQFVSLRIYNSLGKEVKTLVNKRQSPGNYEVKFDASKLASGIYFYKLTAGKFYQTKKMVLLK